jgi:hypothetical protein
MLGNFQCILPNNRKFFKILPITSNTVKGTSELCQRYPIYFFDFVQEFIASIESQAIESLFNELENNPVEEVSSLTSAEEEEQERREAEEAYKRYTEVKRILGDPSQARLADSTASSVSPTPSTSAAAAASTTVASVEEITRQYKTVKSAQRVRLLPIKSSARQPASTLEPPSVVEVEDVLPITYRPVATVQSLKAPKPSAVPARKPAGASASISASAKSTPSATTPGVKPLPPPVTPTYSPASNSFFGRPDPPNAVRVGGAQSTAFNNEQLTSEALPPTTFRRPGGVVVDNIEVPRLSKMVKNSGLRLLQNDQPTPGTISTNSVDQVDDDTLLPVIPLAKLESSIIEDSIESQATPLPVRATKRLVQGFRIKGDSSNRIVFLNLEDLGFGNHAHTLRIGANELVPIEGLLSSIEDVPDAVLANSPDSSGNLRCFQFFSQILADIGN